MMNCGKLENWELNQYHTTKLSSSILNRVFIKYYIFVSFLTLSLVSCKDNVQSSIPNFPVYLNLDLTAQYPTFKNSYGEFLYFTTSIKASDRIGYGGVIINSGIDDYGNTIYYAFDMACPYEAKNTIRVYPDSTGFSQVICEKCGSVFDTSLGYGNPISGPAKEFLKSYKTSLVGDVLYVSQK